MNNTWKRLTLLLVLLGMFVCTFASCGGSKKPVVTTENNTTADPGTTEAPGSATAGNDTSSEAPTTAGGNATDSATAAPATEPITTEPEPEEPEVPELPLTKNMYDGYEFKMLIRPDSGIPQDLWFDENPATQSSGLSNSAVVDRAVYERNSKIEDEEH